MTQRYRRCLTVPIYFLAVGFHVWLWVMWLGQGMPFERFWRLEKLAAAVMVVMVVTEWSMHQSEDNKQRGFDVLPKE